MLENIVYKRKSGIQLAKKKKEEMTDDESGTKYPTFELPLCETVNRLK